MDRESSEFDPLVLVLVGTPLRVHLPLTSETGRWYTHKPSSRRSESTSKSAVGKLFDSVLTRLRKQWESLILYYLNSTIQTLQDTMYRYIMLKVKRGYWHNQKSGRHRFGEFSRQTCVAEGKVGQKRVG